MHSSVFEHLVENDDTILHKSLHKAGLKHQRWKWIIQAAFYRTEDELKQWADEAETIQKSLEQIHRKQEKDYFDNLINESLENGDAFLHKWTKHLQPPTHTNEIQDNLDKGIEHHYVTHPTEILKIHSKTWANIWQ